MRIEGGHFSTDDGIDIPITIKENLLTYSGMFSEQTAPIGTYDIPIDSEFHGDGPLEP